METRILKEMIGVVKAEHLRRETQLDTVVPDYQYDHWQFTDLPFVNELYLMVLVALRHQVERELVKFAARSSGTEISSKDYRVNVQNERELLRKRDGWKNLAKKLMLRECNGYTFMEALRHLANSYKHGPNMEPDEKLLALLGLGSDVNYAPLPESNALREALGIFVGLGKDAAFYEIAERFVDEAANHLNDIQRRVTLSSIKRGRVSINPKDSLH
jgi:hypothetical protein